MRHRKFYNGEDIIGACLEFIIHCHHSEKHGSTHVYEHVEVAENSTSGSTGIR